MSYTSQKDIKCRFWINQSGWTCHNQWRIVGKLRDFRSFWDAYPFSVEYPIYKIYLQFRFFSFDKCIQILFQFIVLFCFWLFCNFCIRLSWSFTFSLFTIFVIVTCSFSSLFPESNFLDHFRFFVILTLVWIHLGRVIGILIFHQFPFFLPHFFFFDFFEFSPLVVQV